MMIEQIGRVSLASSAGAERAVLIVHVVAGAVALATGFAALAVRKGGAPHRRVGTAFVYAMVVMALVGGALSAYEKGRGVPTGALLTAYFVVTATTALRPVRRWTAAAHVALMTGALAIGLTNLAWGLQTLASDSGRREGLPAFPFLMTGVIGLVAAAGDARALGAIRAGGLRGPVRIARHLWRMCWALWIAAGSFFLGQAKVIPKPIRVLPLLGALAVLPLVALVYWLWRVRGRRSLRGVVLGRATVAAD